LKVALKDLTRKTLKIREEFPTSLIGEGISLLKPVRADLKLNRSGDKVSVRGTVGTVVRLSCSRCLEDFSYDIDTDVDILHQPLKKGIHEEVEELRADDFRVAAYSEPVLNVDEDVKEAIHLAIPMKPLCREECQGLCPRCGQNLNTRRCDCITHSMEKKFSEMGKLLEGKDEQTR